MNHLVGIYFVVLGTYIDVCVRSTLWTFCSCAASREYKKKENQESSPGGIKMSLQFAPLTHSLDRHLDFKAYQ